MTMPIVFHLPLLFGIHSGMNHTYENRTVIYPYHSFKLHIRIKQMYLTPVNRFLRVEYPLYYIDTGLLYPI